MGDIIETTITALQPLLYYKVTSNGMWFDIKTNNRAIVGLCKQGSFGRCRYWIEFSNPGKISITGPSEPTVNKSGLPFTLSEDKYSRFWVAWDCWDSKSISAGIGDSLEVVISSPVLSEFNYITFTTKDESHPCSFKFAVPTQATSVPNEPEMTAGKLHWKACEHQLPDNAVVGGYIDGEMVYVVRARHRQSLTPGVFVPSKGLAFIPWGGSDNPTSNFDALCGFNLKWKAASENRIPVDAFVAGYSESGREPLYIGRAIHQENKIPGKVQLSHRVCYIPHQEREIAIKNFEVLTEPGLNFYCANEFVEPNTMMMGNGFLEQDDEGEDDDYVDDEDNPYIL